MSARLPLLVALLLSMFGPRLIAAERLPNVVLFLVDDMGWMDSSAYRSEYYETPRMDGLAKQSMRFTNAYAVPLCSPTRATILTGQYSARHGVTSASGHQPAAPDGASRYPAAAAPNKRFLYPSSRNYLDPRFVTLAEVLREAGYRTGHFGKWHLGIAPEHRPDRHGFETAWYCVPDPGPPSYFSPYGVHPDGNATGNHKVGTITDGPEGEYITDRLADEAVAFIERHRDEPFFLNLWQYGVHGPWGHEVEYTQRFAEKIDPRGVQKNPIMASMLKSVDDGLGRVLDKLDELGLAEDTLFIFYSDNGGNTHSNRGDDPKLARLPKNHPKQAFVRDWRRWAGDEPPTNNAPLREGKGRIYEGGQRVPLMVRWPGRVPPGTVSDEIVGAIDLYPMILDAVGLERPEGHVVDGSSLLPVLRREGGLDREAYFTWFPHLIPAVSVRAGDWKLIRRWEPHASYPEVRELYNLREDIGETKNLAEEHPEKVVELDKLIDRFIAETNAFAPKPNPAFEASAPAAEPDQLRGLVPKFSKAEVVDGVLRVRADGRTPFLGTGRVRTLTGPLTVKMRLRGPAGESTIRWKTAAQENFPETQSVTYSVTDSRDWQDVSVPVPVEGQPGIVRLYLPATAEHTVDVESITISGARGRSVAWNFRTQRTSATEPKPFPGKTSDWNGFVRHDFTIGGKPVLVVTPKEPATGLPWVWHGEFFGHRPAPDIALLERGFHVVYTRIPDMLGCPDAVRHWNGVYRELTSEYGLAEKVALVGLSRGGLYCYNWATANPEKVACIYGDAPVCDFKSWPGGRGKGKGSDRDWKLVLATYGFETEAEALAYDGNPVDQLAPLAKAKVPLLHVYGDADDVVPWDENTGVIATRYRELGGDITLIAKPGVGHHPHGLEDSTPIVEFIVKHASVMQH